MCKSILLVVAMSLAVTVAAPGFLGHPAAPYLFAPHPYYPYRDYLRLHEPLAALKAGAVIESVPAAVSHQSSSIVHTRAHLVHPPHPAAVLHAPAPIIKAFGPAPVVVGVGFHGPHW